MISEFNDKNIIITGSRKGVGKLIAEYYLSLGARVIGFSRGSSTIEHSNYFHYQLDIADAKAVQSTCIKVSKEFSKVHILINNAGVLTSQYSLIMPASNASNMINTNLLGTFFVSREVAKIMCKHKYGRIVNISSMAAILEPAGDSIYAASKAAVITLANVMSKEFSSYNITCNTLGITAIESDMLEQLPRVKIDEIINSLPLKRYSQPEDIFNVLSFLTSSKSDYITAQSIFLGGVH